MYEAADKKILYFLINLYVQGKVNESLFSREFCSSYDHEIDYETLTHLEKEIFDHLSNVASRFSPFQEDHTMLPNTFYTATDLKEAILEVKEKLKDQWLI